MTNNGFVEQLNFTGRKGGIALDSGAGTAEGAPRYGRAG